jgi:NAD(P)-dependent dehydrogenase (short-subunit alcohol dehydrogenase family)
MAEAEKIFGRVDYVFANAGIEGGKNDLADWSAESFLKILHVNVVGVAMSLKHALPVFRKNGGGALIAVSSIGSSLRSDQIFPPGNTAFNFAVPYTISKACLDSWARLSARMYGFENIRIYNMKPAAYSSEIVDRIADHLSITPTDFSNFNPYFQGTIGDPALLADVALSMFDNTTRWRPGEGVICDGDATFAADVLNLNIDDPESLPPNKKQLEPHLCNAQGGPYMFSAEKNEL